MRLEKGMVVRTNYDTGPFRIIGITRECVCPHILDTINRFDSAPPLPAHTHLWLRYITKDHNEGKEAFIGYLDEESLRTYGEGGEWSGDEIILCESEEPVQNTIPV